MWKPVKRIFLFVVCSFLLCLPVVGYCTDTTTQQEPTQVVMQLQQYNRLKEIINQQDMTLTQLQVKLNLLNQNSTEQIQTLTLLQNQLDDCKNQLSLTKTQLANATVSLNQAEETLKKQEESLQLLTKQIKQMEHHASVLQRQRDILAVVAVGAFGYALCE